MFTSAGHVTAQHQAYGQIYGLMMREAGMLAYIDNFWMLAVISLIVIPLVFLMKRPPKGSVAAAH
jgi:MFS transporter, DHA2 family, multidrug resistance protein